MAGAVVCAIVGVLFAVLPYTVPIRMNSTSKVECDNAVVQVFGTPEFGLGESTFERGESMTAIKNLGPCESVAHYRLGIAAGFLLAAIALVVIVVVSARRGRHGAADSLSAGQPLA